MNEAKPAPAWGQLLARFSLAVAVGGVGGFVFNALNLPLPWMLGSMAACMVAAIARLPVAAPSQVRPPMSAVVGSLLGAGFPTDILERMTHWLIPLLGLAAFIVAAGLVCVAYFRKVGGFDAKTAYFCGMPGGMIEMTLMGDEVGADGRRIALVHTARVMTIVFIVPFVVRLWEHASPAAAQVAQRASIFEISPVFLLWLAGTCAAGILLGILLRLPAKYLIGPMLVSGALHVSGISDFRIPYELVVIAQIVLGATIGCRFVGVALGEVGRILLLSLGSTLILLSLTALFAFGIGSFTGIDPIAMVLAYSPGGLAEMGLVALALNFDTAFVATHHIARVIFVGIGASLLFRVMDRNKPAGEG